MTDFIDGNTEIETLVGEGRQYATVEDLEKGKKEADKTIKEREEELKETRLLNTTLMEQLDLLKAATAEQARQPKSGEQPNNPAAPEPAIDKEALVRQVRDLINQEETDQKKDQNLKAAVDRLVDVLGSTEKANLLVSEKAQELGVSVQFLKEAAAQSPKAFLDLVGVNQSAQSTPRPSGSDVNQRALRDSSSKEPAANTYEYFQKMRREKPAVWNDPQYHRNIMKAARDAAARGEDFFR